METVMRKFLIQFVAVLLLLALCGCSGVRFVAGYDQQTDVAISQIQRKMEQFLVSLERNMGKDEVSYARSTKFYDELRVDLSAARVRAVAIPDNELTVDELILLSDNLIIMERMHQLGLSANDIPPIRTAFNVSCTAILRLELAKRRGKASTE